MNSAAALNLPPLVTILLLAGISLSTIFLLGRGLFAGRHSSWLSLAGHGGLICLGICTLQLGARMFRVSGADRLRHALVLLALVLVLGVLYRHLFRRGPRGH
jgi:hypothetical protein